MDAVTVTSIEPGMEVFDSSGYHLGEVAFVFNDLIVARDEVRSQPAIEVKTGLFGLGRHLHITAAEIETICPGALLLAKSRADLERAELAHLHHPHA
jgi:hypothetical protein